MRCHWFFIAEILRVIGFHKMIFLDVIGYFDLHVPPIFGFFTVEIKIWEPFGDGFFSVISEKTGNLPGSPYLRTLQTFVLENEIHVVLLFLEQKKYRQPNFISSSENSNNCREDNYFLQPKIESSISIKFYLEVEFSIFGGRKYHLGNIFTLTKQ